MNCFLCDQPINIRLTSDLLDGVDAFAAARSISRAEAIRRLLDRALVEWAAP